MLLKEVTPAALNPVPMREFSAHLRLANGFADDGSEDGLLELYLRNATAVVEQRLGRALVSRPYLLQVASWNRDGHLIMPVGPVQSIERFQLISSAGALDLTEADWALEPGSARQRLTGKHGQALRAIPRGGIGELQFTAGFGTSWNDVPDDIRQAVLLLGAHYYENRFAENDVEGGIPFGVISILEQHRIARL